jgi:two-component system nitrate/nitrite response regulator NarL
VTNPTARAVVIDPDPLWQQAVTAALTRSNVSVVANAGDLHQAPDLADAYGADLLLLGLEDEVDNRELYRLLRRVHQRCPDLVTVVFVENEDRLTVDAALAEGAYWAVDRRVGATELVRAVTEAYTAKREETQATRVVSGARAGLTRREVEILRLAAEGRPNREMATLLWVTEQTIKLHLANTYRKLNVTGRSEAIRWAHEHGFGDTSSGEPGTGVREPRRPIKPSLTGGAAVDPTEHAELPDETDTPRDARSQAA